MHHRQLEMRDEGKVLYTIKGILLDVFRAGRIQALDSLDAEGNMGTKHDPLSSQAWMSG